MAYQKTAKDKAWDKEREKLRHEATMWQKAYKRECESKLILANKNKELQDRIDALELAIIDLSKGQMTPDEAVKNMRKTAQLSDMMKFLVDGSHGMWGL